MAEVLKIIKAYDFYSPIDTVERISGGNINKTYKLTTSDGEKYILQKINTSVFKDPDALMDNVVAVTTRTNAIKKEKSLDKTEFLTIKFTVDGKSYYSGPEGCYRVYEYMPNSVTGTVAQTASAVEDAGRAFGLFDRILNCGEPLALHTVIRDFHNTPKRLADLCEIYKKAPESRKIGVKSTYEYLVGQGEFLQKNYDFFSGIERRVVHNDVKWSNVAFDRKSGRAVGVLDLDTVMYGCIADDFGDGVRSFAGPEKEDEISIGAIGVDMEKYKAFSRGFIGELKEILTDDEKAAFICSPICIALELAMRFLSDHLGGDVYFHTEYEGQNLNRAKCQAALGRDMEARLPDMQKWLKTEVFDGF